jgi:hypothetical protein
MDYGMMSPGQDLASDVWADVWVSPLKPELTVLVPIFEQERFVADAITSVLSQRDIACEILICDDASSDRTWETALQTVTTFLAQQEDGSPALAHSVRVRRNSRTLGRMNIHDMAADATCDTFVQAHGDDLSHPNRMRRIANVFLNPDVTFVASGMRIMDDAGVIDHEATIIAPEGFIDVDTALSRPPWMIGAVEAWRASLLTEGRPLTMDYAPVGHDRIMGIRAALNGAGFGISEPLVDRRHHEHQWSLLLVDAATSPTQSHGWALVGTMVMSAAIDEIDAAEAKDVITAEDAAGYRDQCEAQLAEFHREIRHYAGQLISEGRRLLWT